VIIRRTDEAWDSGFSFSLYRNPHRAYASDLGFISIMISAIFLSSLTFDLMSTSHITSEKSARVSN
jgi:hypothetical protein